MKIKRYFLFLFAREEDAPSLIIDTVRLYSHIYILYIVSTVSQSDVHNRFTGDPTTHWIDRISIKRKKSTVVV